MAARPKKYRDIGFEHHYRPSGQEVLDCAANRRFMLRSVAVGKLEVRDRKPELPSCLHSGQLGTFNSERVAR